MRTQFEQSSESSHSGSSRQHLAAAATLALVVLILFAPLSLHPSDLLVGVQRDGRNDVTAHNLAARDLLRQSLVRDGRLPMWLDSGLLGSPWYGNPQSAMFYPPHWLFLIVSATTGISWLIVAHHWWAGLGLYFYCRRLSCSWPAAMVAAVSFAGAPFLIAQTGEGHSTQVFLIAWAPWAMLVYDSLRRGVRGATPTMAIILAIAFFCGHVQEVYYLVVVLSGFVVCDCLRRERRDLVKPLRLAIVWSVVGVSTAALVAIELAPNWIYTRFGVRSQGIGTEIAGAISAGPASLWQLLNPFALGGPDNYQGPGEFYWETLCCFGLAPLLLAFVGAFQLGRRDRVLRWVALATITLLFAMGGDTPVFSLMHRFIPGMSLFRAPGRALFFTSLAVAVLAGLGWDTIVSALRPWLGDSGARRRLLASVSAAVVAVCVVELSYYAFQLCATVPQTSVRRDSPIIQAILAEQERGRVLAPQELLTDRESLAHGIDKLRRYEPVPLARTLALFDALTVDGNAAQEITGFNTLHLHRYRKPLLDMLNVTHVVLAHEQPVEIEGWELVSVGRVVEELAIRGRTLREVPYAIYRNRSAMPRAYVVGNVITSSAASRLAEIDPRKDLLLANDALASSGPRQSYLDAEIAERTSSRLVVRAELDAPGYLVVSDGFYPGWRSDSDETIIPGNLALRATPLAAGLHTVIYEYSPPGRFLGTSVSVVAWLLVVGSLVKSRLLTKRRSPARTDQESTSSSTHDSSIGNHAARTMANH